MSQPKQLHFKKYHYAFSAFGALVLSCLFVSASPSVATAIDCSDVYTPLSSHVVNGVAANKTFYVQAMNETGVPWEMLAAIHYRETNFSHTNPSNGQGIFQFVNGDGGPYPPGPVSDANFYQQLKFMANKLQSDYVWRGSISRERRQLTPNEHNMTIIKDTLYSYNGRASAYATQAATYGYSSTSQPYEGSPYVMNRFDCPRARMGIITRDYATGIDGTDTRYGAFTIFARLRGEAFWLLMTRAYSWQLISQEAYLDAERTKPADTGFLAANQKVYFRLKARNIGSATWTKETNPILLASTNPPNRTSSLCDASWVNCSRPALLVEGSVTPGNTGTFEFSMTTSQLGQFKEYFNLVAEGKEWFNDFGLHWNLDILPPTPRWQVASQQLFADAARTQPVNPESLAPNTTYYSYISARNTGNTTWTNTGSNPVRLGTNNPQDRASTLSNGSWITPNRAATLNEAQVKPGETGSFVFSFTTPPAYGSLKEGFRPVVEGSNWMNDIGFHWPLTVEPPTAKWSVVSQQAFTSNTKSTILTTSSIANGSRIFLSISARNTGNTTWTNTGSNPVRLGTNNPQDRGSEFYDSSWVGQNRPATLKESSVAPGQIGTFEFWMQAPFKLNGTTLHESFRPVVEGKSWMNDIGMYQPFVFNSPDTNWQYIGQNAYSDSARQQTANLSSASTNTTYYLRLHLKNTSGLTWNQSTFLLGTNNPQDRTSNFYHASWLGSNRPAQLKEGSVAPGQQGTFEFSVKTPVSPVQSNEYFRPVIEGKTWLTDIGLYWGFNVQ